MNKQTFLDELGAHLAALGADRMVVAAQKAKMDAYLRSKNMENVDVDPAKMAEGIMEKLKSEAADRAAEQAHGDAPADRQAEPPKAPAAQHRQVPMPDKAREEAVKAAARHAEETPAANRPAAQATAAAPARRPDAPANAAPHAARPVPAAHPAAQQQRTPRDGAKPSGARPAQARRNPDPVTDPEYYEGAKQRPALSEEDEEELKQQTIKRVLFCVAIPFAALLAAAAALVFLGIIALLAAVAVGFIALLIVIVGAGCSVSLIGIIYGAYKIVTGVVPVGLYEIGLGITIGSVASLIGILMYNAAIRLVPFLIKKITQLAGYAALKSRDGFIALKGAIEKQ